VSKASKDMGFKVTAAICCYNAENFIKAAVLSLLNQTRPPDEVIVVDDGSTDKSIETIRDLKIKIIKHESNKGLSVARNTVLKNAKGNIIVYIDSDTVADNKITENMLQHYVSDDIYAVGGQGSEVNINNIFDKWRKFNAFQSLGEKVIENAEMLPGLCCSYRKSALEKVGGFDEFFARNAEDHDISIRLRKAGGRLVYSPDIKVEHYRTDTLASLVKMIYRYDLWTIIAKKRNKVDTRKSMRIPLFRIGVFFKRILHIFKCKVGIKFALIDFLMIFVSIFAIIKYFINHSKSS
jgi:peptidoglycan-N-acetylglucosamine deacetylase